MRFHRPWSFARILAAALIASAALAFAADTGVNTHFSDLQDPDAKVRAQAARGIADMGLGARAVKPLLRTLNDPVSEVRASAADALGRLGVDAKDAIPALVRLLRDPDDRARASAVSALGGIGPPASRAVPDLIDMLKDESATVRYSTAYALGVECQQVVHRKHESGEGRTVAESGVRAMPVVVVQPG